VRSPTERGAALLLVLLATTLLAAIGIGLVLMTMAETAVAGGYRQGREVFYAADAVFEWSVAELGRRADIDEALAGGAPTAFGWGESNGAVPFNAGDATRIVQQASDLVGGGGANRTIWRLLGHGGLSGLTGVPSSTLYVAVWVGDDAAETDGVPAHDANGLLRVHAEAYGPREARAVIEGLLSRVSPEGVPGNGAVRVVSWGEVRPVD
jgi:hypothetical protein